MSRRARRLIIPPPVPAGGTIAVVSPGSRVRAGAVRSGARRIESWGYRTVFAPGVFARNGDLAGDDARRAADLEWALTAPGIDAVWAARGGWGSARLLERLDLDALRRAPRWLIGFSDITTLELQLLQRGVASWHAPLVADLDNPRRFVAKDLMAMLRDPLAERHFAPGARRAVRGGRASGPLAGGCLTLLAGLAGTRWQPDLRGCVVFLEEVAEAPYRIDRLLWQLQASGMFSEIAGLAYGQFAGCRPAKGRPSRSLATVLGEFADTIGVPTLAGLPFGHGPKARAVPLGFEAALDARAGTLTIRPPAPKRR